MRLIDADALIEECGGWYVEEGTESGFIGTLRQLLASQPIAQSEQRWQVMKCIDGGHLKWFYSRTVAWRPLPEPYRGGEKDDR